MTPKTAQRLAKALVLTPLMIIALVVVVALTACGGGDMPAPEDDPRATIPAPPPAGQRP